MLYTVDKGALAARAAEYVREATPPAAGPAPAATNAAVVAASAATDRDVALALKNWADAWSSRNAPAYLDAYADTFAPADGGGRPAWSAKRKQVIAAARDIQLDIADVKVVAGTRTTR